MNDVVTTWLTFVADVLIAAHQPVVTDGFGRFAGMFW